MNTARIIAIAVLIFVGFPSLMGAIPLIIDPSGTLLKMPLSLLARSPFTSFFVPGMILLLANGVLSLVVLIFTWRKVHGYGWWIALQGCVLGIWITVQVLMIRMVIWAHCVYWATALVLIVCGWLLTDDSPDEAQYSGRGD